MTELELYKFCSDKELDWRRDNNLYMWLSFHELSEFTELLGNDFFVESPMSVGLFYESVVINLVDVCFAHGIDPERIKNKDN